MNLAKFVSCTNVEELVERCRKWKRVFVRDLDKNNVDGNCKLKNVYLFVNVVKKLDQVEHGSIKEDVAKFTVEEVQLNQDELVYSGYFDIRLENFLSAKDEICDKICCGDLLCVCGFVVKINSAIPKVVQFSSASALPSFSFIGQQDSILLHVSNNRISVPAQNDHISQSSIYGQLKGLQPTPYVSCFGVVIHFERFTSSDKFRILRLVIVDDSFNLDETFTFIIKSDSDSTSPPVSGKFDIVRFTRVSIANNSSTGRIQGFARVGAGGFDCMVWAENSENPRTTDSSGGDTYISKEDLLIVNKLRTWTNDILKPLMQDDPEESSTIRRLLFGTYGNVVAQVIGVGVSSVSTATVMRVWDATKSVCELSYVNFDTEMRPILCRDKQLESFAGKFAVDVMVYDEHCSIAEELEAGSFVRLHNLHAFGIGKEKTVWLTMHGGKPANANRGIEELTKDDEEVRRLMRRISKNIDIRFPSNILK